MCVRTVFVQLSGFVHLGITKLYLFVWTLWVFLAGTYSCIRVSLDSTRPHAPVVSGRWVDAMPEKQQLPTIKHCRLFIQYRVARFTVYCTEQIVHFSHSHRLNSMKSKSQCWWLKTLINTSISRNQDSNSCSCTQVICDIIQLKNDSM